VLVILCPCRDQNMVHPDYKLNTLSLVSSVRFTEFHENRQAVYTRQTLGPYIKNMQQYSLTSLLILIL
jgi:hypothetical protein